MSIHVTDFKWEKGKNDLKYIELLEKTLKNEQMITAKAVAKIRELSKENKDIRIKTVEEFAERLKKESFNGYTTLENYFEDTVESVALEDVCRIAEEMKEEFY